MPIDIAEAMETEEELRLPEKETDNTIIILNFSPTLAMDSNTCRSPTQQKRKTFKFDISNKIKGKKSICYLRKDAENPAPYKDICRKSCA